MRTVRKNKQKLMYALYKGKAPSEYVKDRSGNPVIGKDGNYVIDSSSAVKPKYDTPVEFLGNIAFSKGSGEAESVAFGVSVADYDSTLIMNLGEIPIDETSLIFKDSTPEYDRCGNLKRESADFTVVKVQPSLNMVTYLLKRIIKNGKPNN